MPGPETVGRLREREAAALLDRLDAERAVVVPAGKHDACGQFVPVDGERAEEPVDGPALAVREVLRHEPQATVFEREQGVGAQHVDVIDLDGHAVLHDMHGQRGIAAHDVVQHAFAAARQMRDDDEGEARCVGHAAKEALQRFDAAGRSAHTGDRKVGSRSHGISMYMSHPLWGGGHAT